MNINKKIKITYNCCRKSCESWVVPNKFTILLMEDTGKYKIYSDYMHNDSVHICSQYCSNKPPHIFSYIVLQRQIFIFMYEEDICKKILYMNILHGTYRMLIQPNLCFYVQGYLNWFCFYLFSSVGCFNKNYVTYKKILCIHLFFFCSVCHAFHFCFVCYILELGPWE